MEFKVLRTLYNQCNPDEPLSPGDPRNVQVDLAGVRGERWSDKLARQVELSNTPVCQLFTGLRGTGKSTELQRLRARLGDERGMNLLTVSIDADDVFDLSREIDVSDVLSLILARVERDVLVLEGRSGADALMTGPFARLWAWLVSTDVELQKASVNAGVVGLDLSFKTNPILREQVRRAVSRHLSVFVLRIREDLTILEQRAKTAGKSGLFVVFDSLEKLSGTSLTWKAVLDSAERIFGNGAPYLQLPVHVIYTIPPAVQRRIADPPVAFLPMIKVREKDGTNNSDGMNVVFDIVKKRIPESALVELFGEGDIRDRLLAIALWSGGYPREIVRLLQEILSLETFPVSRSDLEHVLERASNTYRGIVHSSGAMPWLATVLHTKKLVANNDAEREAADLFMQTNIILRYLNTEEWFDVHPSVAGLEELASPLPKT